jgi:hypothetical protein
MNNGENGITNNHSRRTFVKSAVGVLGTTEFDVSALNAIALADGKGIEPSYFWQTRLRLNGLSARDAIPSQLQA